MSDEAKNHGTPMAQQMDYLKRASTSERDQWDEQAERLLPSTIGPIYDPETDSPYYLPTQAEQFRPAVVAELRKRDQRIERLEAALRRVQEVGNNQGTVIEIARAALED